MTRRGQALLRGGVIVDGTGEPARNGDVLLKDGAVAALGTLGQVPEAETIDISGRLVAPGFIDIHQHSDFTVLAFPGAENAVMQGITTIVNGNCGGGVAPAHSAHDVRRVAFGYSDKWGVDISWTTFGNYLSHLKQLAVNVATLVPHGAVRNAVMGLDNRSPRPDELRQMVDIVEESLDAGAIGLSSGLEYPPGCFADTPELVALAEVVSSRGGFYASHIRNRAETFWAATQEALEVARLTGVRLQLSHFVPRPYAQAQEATKALEAVEQARSAGAEVWVDTFPETWPGMSRGSVPIRPHPWD